MAPDWFRARPRQILSSQRELERRRGGSGKLDPRGVRADDVHDEAATTKPAAKPKKPVLHGNPARALVAFEAMQKFFYIRGSGLYKGEPFSYLWPFSQALAATVSMANIPHLRISLVARTAGAADRA